MRAPPLGNRVVAGGVSAVALVLVIASTFTFVTVSQQFNALIEETLATRTDVAIEIGTGVADHDEFARRLVEHGVPAIVADGDGTLSEIGLAPDGERPTLLVNEDGELVDDFASSAILYDDDSTVTVFASREGVSAIERQLFMLLVAASVLGIALAWLTLRRASTIALSPLRAMASTVRSTRAGSLDERLRPTRTDTEVGELAIAFDEMLDDLQRSMNEIEEADERSRRFLADAAHQLRTPIASIRAAVEGLLRTENEADREVLYQRLMTESIRSGYVISKLLRMARLDQGALDERELVDFVALAREEVERTAELAPQLDVTFTNVNGHVELLVDAGLIRESIINLLVNARRHARSKIEVELRTVNDETVEVGIRDDGDGLAEDLVDLAFERFATLDGKGGAGLGLPIARQIARTHGGDVVYEHGEFIVRLPLRSPAEQPPLVMA